nr:SpaA isopeptide-forming pilin-related protein [Bacillus subtilis]
MLNRSRIFIQTSKPVISGIIKSQLQSLAPGQYAFVETKAPAGYVLNTEKIEFEISDSSEGKPEATDAGIAIKAFQSSGERRKHVIHFTIKAAHNN